MFQSIRSKLLLFSTVSILATVVTLTFSYMIAVRQIRTIMVADLMSVADALEKNITYIAGIRPDAYREEVFKKSLCSVRIGKSGYPFMLDEAGTLVVHPKDEGKNLAGQKHIDFIRSHREPGIYDYTATTTGQDKIVAFRYIEPWRLWIVPGVNKADYLAELQHSFLMWSVLIGVAMVLLLTAMSVWIHRGVAAPVRRVVELAGKLASGDLTLSIETGKGGEAGKLLTAIGSTINGLASLVARIGMTASGLAAISKSIDEASARVVATARQQRENVDQTSSAILEITATTRQVAGEVEAIAQASSETSSSILQMSASIDEVAMGAESLACVAQEVDSSISEMSSATRQINDNVRSLIEASTEAASSIEEMDATIRQVQQSAMETAAITDKVRSDAVSGKEAVAATIAGINVIRDSAHAAAGVIGSLSDKAASIDAVVSVIEEVAKQTSLLSLNAAIIAAQAGAEGKGFAVVADEIKSLANRTSRSTSEIAELVKGVQEETRRAVTAIMTAEQSVAAGVGLSMKSGDILDLIVTGADQANSHVDKIARATGEQAVGSRMIRETMEQVSGMVVGISQASHAQEQGDRIIMQACTRLKDLAVQVKNSTREQSQVSSDIARTTERAHGRVDHLRRACEEQAEGTGHIIRSVEDIQHATEVNLEAAGMLEKSMETLLAEIENLRQGVAHFKVHDRNSGVR
jgi:methyl-accepting chemotaxis protein